MNIVGIRNAHPYLNSSCYELRKRKIDSLGISWKGKRILDVGCGVGIFSRHFQRGGQVIGVDIAQSMLRIAVANSEKLHYIKATLSKLPFRSGTFDVIFASNVLGHIVDEGLWMEALEEMRRLIKEDGVIIIDDRFGNSRESWDMVTRPLSLYGQIFGMEVMKITKYGFFLTYFIHGIMEKMYKATCLAGRFIDERINRGNFTIVVFSREGPRKHKLMKSLRRGAP